MATRQPEATVLSAQVETPPARREDDSYARTPDDVAHAFGVHPDVGLSAATAAERRR